MIETRLWLFNPRVYVCIWISNNLLQNVDAIVIKLALKWYWFDDVILKINVITWLIIEIPLALSAEGGGGREVNTHLMMSKII